MLSFSELCSFLDFFLNQENSKKKHISLIFKNVYSLVNAIHG